MDKEGIYCMVKEEVAKEEVAKYEGIELSKFMFFKKNSTFSTTNTKSNEEIKYRINSEYDEIKKDNPLKISVFGGIKRLTQSISVSEGSYSYRIGSTSSIKIGDTYNKINLKEDSKLSIHTGQSVSMTLGDSTSENHIKTNFSRKMGNTFSISENDEKVSERYTGIDESASVIAFKSKEKKSNFAVDLEFADLRFDYTYIPLKGHFTCSTEVISIVYGDLVHFENLARIIGLTMTLYKEEEKNIEKNLHQTDKSLVQNENVRERVSENKGVTVSESMQVNNLNQSTIVEVGEFLTINDLIVVFDQDPNVDQINALPAEKKIKMMPK